MVFWASVGSPSVSHPKVVYMEHQDLLLQNLCPTPPTYVYVHPDTYIYALAYFAPGPMSPCVQKAPLAPLAQSRTVSAQDG